MTEKICRERWVYIGARLDRDKKLSYVWLKVGDTETDLQRIEPIERDEEKRLYFAKKLIKSGRPGCVYDFDVQYKTNGGVTVLGPNRDYAGFWPHYGQVTVWQAGHEGAIAARAAINKRNKEMRQNTIYRALAPIAEAYRRAAPQARRPVSAYVPEKIQRG